MMSSFCGCAAGLRAGLWCVLVAVVLGEAGEATAADRPNIVLIYADDMGYGDAACYGDTNLVPMPNVDRLAAEGVRMTDGYVTASVCGPSRYGLLTGVYQQKLGVRWNQDAWSILRDRAPETLEDNRIPASQPLMNQTLARAGYRTALFGKSNMPCYPQTTFDEAYSVMAFGGQYFPDEHGVYAGVDAPKAVGGHKRILWGPERPDDEYLTDRLGRQTVEFIERESATDRPFFAYLAFNAPHSPMQAKTSHRDAVAHLETEATRMYAAMLLSMDENIGRVLDALDRLGLADNTLVAFASDNGPTFAYSVLWPEDWPREVLGSAGPLRGYKGQQYEGGIRVPFVLRWPGKIAAGSVYREPVSTLDLYPTFLAAAGAKVGPQTQLDGVDLLPFLSGQTAGAPHEQLYWMAEGRGAIRQGDWKLHVGGAENGLYNLREDVGETADRAAEHPERVAEMTRAFRAFADAMPPVLNPGARKKH